jgi:hypothetical protein
VGIREILFMKFNACLIITLSLFATTANAVPYVYVKPCLRSNLIQQVNIVLQDVTSGKKVDPRGAVTVKGPELGLSPEEIAQTRNSTGVCYCPGIPGTPATSETPEIQEIRENGGSCSLFMDSGMIISADHVFNNIIRDARTKGYDCYFQNQAVHPEVRKLDFRPQHYVSGADPNSPGPKVDIEVVRLDKPITVVRLGKRIEATAYQPPPREWTISQKDDLIVVAGIQGRLQAPVRLLKGSDRERSEYPFSTLDVLSQPIVEPAIVKNFPPLGSADKNIVYTNGAATVGTSGALNLERINGQLVAVGITTQGPDGYLDQSGKKVDFKNRPIDENDMVKGDDGKMVSVDELSDYAPYNASHKNGKPLSFSIVSTFTPEILDAAEALSKLYGTPPAQ